MTSAKKTRFTKTTLQEPKITEIPSQSPPPNIFGAFFLITLGSLFLLNNFGLLPWSIWTVLWKFWPLILILSGLQIIAGQSRIASFFVTLLGIGLIILTILFALNAAPTTSLDIPEIFDFDQLNEDLEIRLDKPLNLQVQ